MNYPYRWSINIGINPVHFFWMKIWIGERNWWWSLNHPLTVKKG